MRKVAILYVILLFCTQTAWSQSMMAIGLNDPSETWGNFETNSLYIYQTSYLGYSEFSIANEFIMTSYFDSRPTNQPFKIILHMYLPDGCIIIGASVLIDDKWSGAQPQDIPTAEKLYNAAAKNQPRCLLRQQVKREYNGSLSSIYQLELSPVYYQKKFGISIKYLLKNNLGLDAAWNSPSALRSAFISTQPAVYHFQDLQFPDARPSFLKYDMAGPFLKESSGWWKATIVEDYWQQDLLYSGIIWPISYSTKPQLFLFSGEDGDYYQFCALPPLSPNERNPKKVLILYDLGSPSWMNIGRDILLNSFQKTVEYGLAEYDSLNIVLIDQLQPKYLRPRFIAASSHNTTVLFNELSKYPIPQMSATTQLLCSARDFYNTCQTGGEIWFITTAERDAYPIVKANDIIDLTLNKMHYPTRINIFACGNSYEGSYYYLSGRYYSGNDYLFENLTRLTGGTYIRSQNYNEYTLPLALADTFVPALDLMEVEVFPTNGYYFGKYKYNSDRSHYPIVYPYMELGRYQGALPFSVDFYGNVDGQWFHKQITNKDTTGFSKLTMIKTIWHFNHVQELLQQPQAWSLVDEIGRLSKENHFVSPYCGFVIPSSTGYSGFKRLEALDSVQVTNDSRVLPEAFEVSTFPNPFNSEMKIQIDIKPMGREELIQLRIVNILGRIVRQWTESLPSGKTKLQLVWNGEDEQHQSVGNGVYFVVLQVNNQKQTIKVTCLK